MVSIIRDVTARFEQLRALKSQLAQTEAALDAYGHIRNAEVP